jgi:hypothetical protein
MDEVFGDATIAPVLKNPEAALAEQQDEKIDASGAQTEIVTSV